MIMIITTIARIAPITPPAIAPPLLPPLSPNNVRWIHIYAHMNVVKLHVQSVATVH